MLISSPPFFGGEEMRDPSPRCYTAWSGAIRPPGATGCPLLSLRERRAGSIARVSIVSRRGGQYDWDYRRYDAECWAEYYSVPYKEPRGAVEFDPRLLARACAAADALGAVRPYSESMFEAIFAEGLPEIGEGECLERAEAVGLSGDAFAGELASPGPERRLAETAAEAHSAGAFGVPTCRLAMPKSVRGNSPPRRPGLR